MTCLEKLKLEHPENVNSDFLQRCPNDYGYMSSPDYCGDDSSSCERCWNREIPETENAPSIKDSGDRTEFETGAVRDMHEGKGRCDLMPLDVIGSFFYYISYGQSKTQDFKISRVLGHIANFTMTGNTDHLFKTINAAELFNNKYDMFLEVAKHFEEGCKKYGENNWRKGIPAHCYVDSAVRHYLKHLRGDMDERHDRAFVWNILCCIWTCIHKPELNDYKKES